ncbi:hypothetical protein [Geomonas edaphica]|uniref:hypothetical protein n=1 Tax=Geomonas edaphica TaxID=2570226 RepID=UPI0010A770EB|nr:hypothetical protein [Geomonas edaphica]
MLKKIALTLAAVAVMAAGAYAGSTYTSVDAVTALNFKPSNKVVVMYSPDTVASSPQSYVIASKNTAGDTIYATSNISTTIYKIVPTVSTTVGPGIPLSATDSNITALSAGESVFSGWTAM